MRKCFCMGHEARIINTSLQVFISITVHNSTLAVYGTEVYLKNKNITDFTT